MARTVIAVYDSAYVAKKAYAKLRDLGCAKRHIGMSKDSLQSKTLQLAKAKSLHPEIALDELQAGRAVGAGLGVSAAMVCGIMLGFGKIDLPFLARIAYGNASLLLQIGALIVMGLAGGAILGSLLGGIVGLGIPENEVERYARMVHPSHFTLLLMAEGYPMEDMLEALEAYNPLEIHQQHIEWKKTPGKEKKPAGPGPNGNPTEQDHLP